MSIRQLILELEEENKRENEEFEKKLAEKQKTYINMCDELNKLKEEFKKTMDNILKNLDGLVANKHTIEKAVEQTENIDGLPIPQDLQRNFTVLVNKINRIIVKFGSVSNLNHVSFQKLNTNVVELSKSVENDMKSCYSVVLQAEALLRGTKALINLMDDTFDDSDSKAEGFENSVLQ